MLALALGLVTFHSYAATPQRAALRVVDFRAKPVVRRINVVGRYAMVLTRGGVIEGSRATNPILLERFSFGWQALDVINSCCVLEQHNLGASVNAKLMRSMPTPANDSSCGRPMKDVGPGVDVEAVRKEMPGPLVL